MPMEGLCLRPAMRVLFHLILPNVSGTSTYACFSLQSTALVLPRCKNFRACLKCTDVYVCPFPCLPSPVFTPVSPFSSSCPFSNCCGVSAECGTEDDKGIFVKLAFDGRKLHHRRPLPAPKIDFPFERYWSNLDVIFILIYSAYTGISQVEPLIGSKSYEARSRTEPGRSCIVSPDARGTDVVVMLTSPGS
jgi:hypothetical protein